MGTKGKYQKDKLLQKLKWARAVMENKRVLIMIVQRYPKSVQVFSNGLLKAKSLHPTQNQWNCWNI